MPWLDQSCCAVSPHICNIQKALVKKSKLYVWRKKQPEITWHCKDRYRAYFPMYFCSSASSSSFPFAPVQQRDFRLGWEDKNRKSTEGAGLSRIGWKPTIETEVTLGVQWNFCTQIVRFRTRKVYFFLCRVSTIGQLGGHAAHHCHSAQSQAWICQLLSQRGKRALEGLASAWKWYMSLPFNRYVPQLVTWFHPRARNCNSMRCPEVQTGNRCQIAFKSLHDTIN